MNRDVFREWLRKEIEEVRGLVFEESLEHMPGRREAYAACNQKEVKDQELQSAWSKWEMIVMHGRPSNGPPPFIQSKQPPVQKKEPRGGRYTEAMTKEGRQYRRYF